MVIMFTIATGLLVLGKELLDGRLQIFCTHTQRIVRVCRAKVVGTAVFSLCTSDSLSALFR